MKLVVHTYWSGTKNQNRIKFISGRQGSGEFGSSICRANICPGWYRATDFFHTNVNFASCL